MVMSAEVARRAARRLPEGDAARIKQLWGYGHHAGRIADRTGHPPEVVLIVAKGAPPAPPAAPKPKRKTKPRGRPRKAPLTPAEKYEKHRRRRVLEYLEKARHHVRMLENEARRYGLLEEEPTS